MILESIGIFCLGTVIGWLVRYFIRRFHSFGPQALGTTISIFSGGGVVKLLKSSEVHQSLVWLYPIGLFVGFVLYSFLAWKAGADSDGTIYWVTSEPGKASLAKENLESD